MIYLCGNCQTKDVSKILKDRDIPCVHKWLASPLTYLNSAEKKDYSELNKILQEQKLEDYLNQRTLVNQIDLIGSHEPEPELIVLNIFHEPINYLYMHKNQENRFYFYIHDVPKNNIEFRKYLHDNFNKVKIDPYDYVNNYIKMLEVFSKKYQCPIFILLRAKPYDFLGETYSYLKCWSSKHISFTRELEKFVYLNSKFQIIDINNIFHEMLFSNANYFRYYFPLLRLKNNEQLVDLEHCHRVIYERVADHIFNYYHGIYKDDNVFDIDKVKFHIETQNMNLKKYTDRILLQKHFNGSFHDIVYALSSFFFIRNDCTPIIHEYREKLPAHPRVLNLLVHYFERKSKKNKCNFRMFHEIIDELCSKELLDFEVATKLSRNKYSKTLRNFKKTISNPFLYNILFSINKVFSTLKKIKNNIPVLKKV